MNRNRALSGEPLCRFILISFAQFRAPRREPSGDGSGGTLQPATPRECTDYAIRLLREGIWLNGIAYNFYLNGNPEVM